MVRGPERGRPVGVGAGPASVPSDAVTVDANSGNRFEALSPARLLDTREGKGAPQARLGAGSSLDLKVTGVGGVPATGVSAVVLNVTVTTPSETSFLTAYPTGQERPNASNLNYRGGQTVPNLVTAKVGAGGQVSLYNHLGDVDVIADVVGWYDDGGGKATGLFGPLPPARLLDTREGLGAAAATVGAGSSIDLQVTGRGGVPASGVSGVVLNVTATQPSEASFVTVYPAGTERPNASNLNFVAGQTIPNLVMAKVSANGKVSLYNHLGNTNLIADVVGWFDDGSGKATGSFGALAPVRLLDTREGNGVAVVGKVGPDSVTDLVVTGRGGVPASGATAVVLNVTVTEPNDSSFVTVYPAGTTRPNASNLNFVANTTTPNLVTAQIGADGKVSLYNLAGTTHLIADVVGWYGG